MDALNEGSFRRALRDTWDQVQSPLFWVAQVIATVGLSIFAVSLYPEGSSALDDAQTQGGVLVAGLFSLLLGVFLANFIALSPRRQRTEARTLATRLHRENCSDAELTGLIEKLLELQIVGTEFAEVVADPTQTLDQKALTEWLAEVRLFLREAGRRYESGVNVISNGLNAEDINAVQALNQVSELLRSTIEGLELSMSVPLAASLR